MNLGRCRGIHSECPFLCWWWGGAGFAVPCQGLIQEGGCCLEYQLPVAEGIGFAHMYLKFSFKWFQLESNKELSEDTNSMQ